MNPARTRPGASGFTLIEILLSLSLVSLIVAVVAVSTANIYGGRLVNACTRISAYVRYAYDLSQLHGKPYKLVIDVDGGSFWLEALEDEDECRSKLSLLGDTVALDEGDAALLEGGSKYKDVMVKTAKLPKGVSFGGIISAHGKELQRSGQDFVLFFPDGTAEKAYIWLAEGEDVYTMEVSPLRGTALMHRKELSDRDFMRR